MIERDERRWPLLFPSLDIDKSAFPYSSSSQWDNLELSDDSDVEVHPNVDKKSFIRWKQRDIHEKRDIRKQEVAAYKAELAANDALEPMLQEVTTSTQKEGHSYYSRQVARLSADRQSRGNKDGPHGPTHNDMMLSLLLQINEDGSVKGKQGSDLDEALVNMLQGHQGKLQERTKQLKTDIQKIEDEEKKKITSDGLREGFSSGFVSKAEKEEIPSTSSKTKSTKKERTAVVETINSPSGSSSKAPETSPDSDAEDDDDDVPDLTPMMKAFGLLPHCIPPAIPLSASSLPSSFTPKQLNGQPFADSLQFLSGHKVLLREESGTTDALLVEAFQSQMRGQDKRARGFVEKGLMVQYLSKLGADGVNLFFRRMASADGKAVTVFFNDVLSTYRRIADRCQVLKKEQDDQSGSTGRGAGEEQIQLVAEDPSTVITFEVPEGPAPEVIEIDRSGIPEAGADGEEEAPPQVPSEEQVRQFLDMRWDVFQSFSPDLQEALKTKSLDKVNKVLASMPVEEAEQVVGQLDQAGILNFGSSEVRDETGK